jgi:hypothetical protein
VPHGCRRSSEGGFDAAAIQEISRERRQAEGGFSAATIEESPRESSRLANGKVLDAATTQHAARERRREEGGLGMTLGATRERRRRSEGGTNVECSQARDLQVCYLNAQRANLDSEIEIEFLSGEGPDRRMGTRLTWRQ